MNEQATKAVSPETLASTILTNATQQVHHFRSASALPNSSSNDKTSGLLALHQVSKSIDSSNFSVGENPVKDSKEWKEK